MSDAESAEPFLNKDEAVWSQRRHHYGSRQRLILYILQAFTIFLLPISFYLGFQYSDKQHPRLPTDLITRNGYKPQLQKLDDEFEITDPKNFKYKGLPRPELDKAWEDLYRHMNVRIHAHEAKATNFSSVMLNDGTGDLFGMPTVFHSIHCLKTLRQLQFPEAYPDTWETYQPPQKGGINKHVDHCIDNLRQTIMCQGDMSLYRFEWLPGKKEPHPFASMDHVCVNWDSVQDWATKRSFSLEAGLFTPPDVMPCDYV